jgi:hypothetical protein
MLITKWMGACALLIATGATAVAASQAPATQDKTARQTVTGCLQGPVPVDEYALSLPSDGATGASGAAVTYRLTGVAMKDAPRGTTIFMLMGNEKQMSPHLGHQVQIVGTTITTPQGRAGKEPALRVESVKMVSAKCPTTGK